MVRRGQMTQEEADKLIRQVEEHQPKRKAAPPPPPAPVKSAHVSHVAHTAHVPAPSHPKPAPAKAAKPAARPRPQRSPHQKKQPSRSGSKRCCRKTQSRSLARSSKSILETRLYLRTPRVSARSRFTWAKSWMRGVFQFRSRSPALTDLIS
jgi:hypothetical protein